MLILNNIMELSEKKLLCVQRQVQLEVESFINRNLEDMYKNIEELKISYDKEMKTMIGKIQIYPRKRLSSCMQEFARGFEDGDRLFKGTV